ncbi:MAG: hypothetical protein AB1576_08705 [Bacillota bacterium]
MQGFVPEGRQANFAADRTKYPVNVVKEAVIKRGVLVVASSPTRFGLSLTVSKEDMDKAVDALDYALGELDRVAGSL